MDGTASVPELESYHDSTKRSLDRSDAHKTLPGDEKPGKVGLKPGSPSDSK